jgi:hypothetical protein
LQLKMLVTEDEDEKNSYIDVIDEWIIIHKSFEKSNVIRIKTMKKHQQKNKKTQNKRNEWIKTLCQKKRNQEMSSSDDSNNDKVTSSIRDKLVESIRVESVMSSSLTVKLTKTKRAKIDTTTANTIIIELTNAVKIAF